MDNISLEDIRQQYNHCLVMANDKLVKVEGVGQDKRLSVKGLLSQKSYRIAFSLLGIKPPNRRLGFVNMLGSVVYVSRKPIRQYQSGLSNENLKFRTLKGRVGYPAGSDRTLNRVMDLDSVEVGEALFNIYPTLEMAIDFAHNFGGAMAFDKQFAVSQELEIFYRTVCVGSVMASAKIPREIFWNPKMEYLSQLLEKGNEHSIPSIRSAA